MQTKPAAQLSLESILERNKAEAQKLKEQADAKLAENERIEAEMNKILKEPPPSRLVQAFQNGHTMERMTLENQQTVPPSTGPSYSTRMVAEKEVIYAALAIVRSWQRRHKKKYHAQEKELMNAVERLTWEK